MFGKKKKKTALDLQIEENRRKRDLMHDELGIPRVDYKQIHKDVKRELKKKPPKAKHFIDYIDLDNVENDN